MSSPLAGCLSSDFLTDSVLTNEPKMMVPYPSSVAEDAGHQGTLFLG